MPSLFIIAHSIRILLEPQVAQFRIGAVAATRIGNATHFFASYSLARCPTTTCVSCRGAPSGDFFPGQRVFSSSWRFCSTMNVVQAPSHYGELQSGESQIKQSNRSLSVSSSDCVKKLARRPKNIMSFGVSQLCSTRSHIDTLAFMASILPVLDLSFSEPDGIDHQDPQCQGTTSY